MYVSLKNPLETLLKTAKLPGAIIPLLHSGWCPLMDLNTFLLISQYCSKWPWQITALQVFVKLTIITSYSLVTTSNFQTWWVHWLMVFRGPFAYPIRNLTMRSQGSISISGPSFLLWDSHYKIRRSSDHLSFLMGISILVRQHLYTEMHCHNVSKPQGV